MNSESVLEKPENAADLLALIERLGGVSPERVRLNPMPGQGQGPHSRQREEDRPALRIGGKHVVRHASRVGDQSAAQVGCGLYAAHR